VVGKTRVIGVVYVDFNKWIEKIIEARVVLKIFKLYRIPPYSQRIHFSYFPLVKTGGNDIIINEISAGDLAGF
jgi:hypothetical protein